MAKMIHFNEEARDQLKKGVDALANTDLTQDLPPADSKRLS